LRDSNGAQLYSVKYYTAILVLQGVPKVLEAFVFEISSKSLGAQKKHYFQIKAEILKFMWVCGKSQFEKKTRTE
jgi:hypothetical protein